MASSAKHSFGSMNHSARLIVLLAIGFALLSIVSALVYRLTTVGPSSLFSDAAPSGHSFTQPNTVNAQELLPPEPLYPTLPSSQLYPPLLTGSEDSQFVAPEPQAEPTPSTNSVQ